MRLRRLDRRWFEVELLGETERMIVMHFQGPFLGLVSYEI
jgi:hypothetical protein